MAVERIEQFRQQNGVNILKVYCKPTAKFPEGRNFFYAPAEAVNLVNKHTWYLSAKGRKGVYVMTYDNSTYHGSTILFHAKLFEFYNNYKWQEDIDHINLVEIDNTDANLNAVNQMQNGFNKLTRGYLIDTRFKPAIFRARIRIDDRDYYPFKHVRQEDKVCSIQNYAEQVVLKESLDNQYYMFNFFKYRRGSEDILDLERTGKISEEEAVYQHILRYSDNAWYMLRYGLEQYYIENHIPIPRYSLDSNGFMVHPITGQKLCPF